MRGVHRRRWRLLVGAVLLADTAILGHSTVVRIACAVGALVALVSWLRYALLAHRGLTGRIHRAW